MSFFCLGHQKGVPGSSFALCAVLLFEWMVMLSSAFIFLPVLMREGSKKVGMKWVDESNTCLYLHCEMNTSQEDMSNPPDARK